MEYKNFEVDFVERTLRDLDVIQQKVSFEDFNGKIEGFYELTFVINMSLGLLAFPSVDNMLFKKQKISEHCIGDVRTCLVKRRKGKKKKQKVIWLENQDLNTIVRHMRNSICHRNFRQEVVADGVIKSLLFEDFDTSEHNKKTFSAYFTPQQLFFFCLEIAKLYTKLKQNNK